MIKTYIIAATIFLLSPGICFAQDEDNVDDIHEIVKAVRRLHSKDDYERTNANKTLMAIEAKIIVHTIINVHKLQDVLSIVNTRDIKAIKAEITRTGVIREKIEAAIPTLIDALKDTDADVRINASKILSVIGAKAETAVNALIDALKDTDFRVRMNAAEALGKIGAKAEAAVDALIDALKDTDAVARGNAAEALGKIGAKAETAIDALIDALKDETWYVRRNAAEALGKIGKKAASDALKQLAENDKHSHVKNAAKKALEAIEKSSQEENSTESDNSSSSENVENSVENNE